MEDYQLSRIWARIGAHNLPFSYPVSLLSSYLDNERGAWARAELLNYVTGNELWWRNGLLNRGEPLELCHLDKSETWCS